MSIENDILREIDFTVIITEFASGPSIKHVMLFLANFDPLPLSHCVPHPGTPQSTSHISDPPIFSRPSTKSPDKSSCTNSLLIVRGVFVQGLCPGWFLSIPPSVRIHLLQQKGKHHFKLHVSYV